MVNAGNLELLSGVSPAPGDEQAAPRVRPVRRLRVVADNLEHTFECDALACEKYSNHLLYVSLAGPATMCKAFRALMYMKEVSYEIYTTERNVPDGLEEVRKAAGSARLDPFYPRYMIRKDDSSYQQYSANLGINTWHLVMISNRAGFMPTISDEALWQELKRSEYTTPIIREWVPWIAGQLKEKGYVKEAEAWGCIPCLLKLTTEGLDAIVADGLKKKKLVIPS